MIALSCSKNMVVGVAYLGDCADKCVSNSCLTLLSMKLRSTDSMLLLHSVVLLWTF